MANMRTHADIVRAAGPENLAEQFKVSVNTARSWMTRSSIPPEYWAVLAEDGKASLEELAQARRAA